MTLFPLATMGLFGGAWVVGGSLRRIRVIACPIIIGIGVGWMCRNAVVGILTCLFAQNVRTGYGNYDPQDPKMSLLAQFWASLGIRDTQGALIRLSWAVLVSTAIALPWAFFGSHWGAVGLYVAGNCLINWGGCKLRLPVYLMDACVATALSSLVLLVK